MENEDMLWAAVCFHGGIARNQEAPCGAVSSSVIALGFRHRCPLSDKERAEQARKSARQEANELVKSFAKEFGTITCHGLLGFDFSDEAANRHFRESGMAREKCDKYIEFVVDKLYELDTRSRG